MWRRNAWRSAIPSSARDGEVRGESHSFLRLLQLLRHSHSDRRPDVNLADFTSSTSPPAVHSLARCRCAVQPPARDCAEWLFPELTLPARHATTTFSEPTLLPAAHKHLTQRTRSDDIHGRALRRQVGYELEAPHIVIGNLPNTGVRSPWQNQEMARTPPRSNHSRR